MRKKNTAVKIVISCLILIIAIFIVFAGSIMYVTRYKIHDIDSSLSQDGTHELLFQQVGDPDWPFGSTHARVILKDGNKIITKYKFDVHNDGVNVSENSWLVYWDDYGVDYVVYGEEQSDQLYRLFFDGRVKSRSLDTHYGANYEYQATKIEEETNPVDEDGYPFDEEWQLYKNELFNIANTIGNTSDSDVEYRISAKGYPYAIIMREIDENTGEKVEQHLIFNESYVDSSNHEYVLEKYSYTNDESQVPTQTIIDFYLIDCSTLEVTDEHTNTWH